MTSHIHNHPKGRKHGRKMRPARLHALNSQNDKYAVTISNNTPRNLPPQKPLALEIGFGNGEHLLNLAALNPDTGFIGAEIYINGIAKCLHRLADDPLPNIRIFNGDCRLLLAALPDQSLAAVYILFPDPWPKTRHHKRRLVQPDFLDLLAARMRPDAALHFASDDIGYQAHMLALVLAHPAFAWPAAAAPHPAAVWSAAPPPSRYRRKARKTGKSAPHFKFTRRLRSS